jgi:N-acetylmuramoyl-L-alanine amidase
VRRRRTFTALVTVIVVASVVAIGHDRATPTLAASASRAAPSGQGDRALFAPGACVSMAPTRGDRHQTVFLDAGHGGPDPGASGTTTDGRSVDERALTLPVVLDAAASLRAAGYRVVVSRAVDTSVARLVPADLDPTGSLSLQGEHDDTEARVTCANLSGAAVLMSVHFNAFSDPTARGLLTTYDDSRPFTAANQQFAQLVDADVLSALHQAGWDVPDRGVLPDTTVGAPALSVEAHEYGHLLLLGPAAAGWLAHPTSMPGALVEPLFLTDPPEASVAADPVGQRAIAAGIVSAIESFVSWSVSLSSGPPTTRSG